MRFLFIMDRADKMVVDKDTSYALMRGANARGHQCFHCLPEDVLQEGRTLSALARPLTVRAAPPGFELGAEAASPVSGFDAVFVRKDPPFDTAYLHLTQQLDLVSDETLVINSPQGLRDANEKLFAFHFAEAMPRSVVASRPAQLLEFLRDCKKAVLKPLDGAGGSGVVMTSSDDRNARALIDLMTREGRELIVAQAFEEDVTAGDKRVLLLGTKILGAILRLPRADDFRANIHVGGRVVATELTPKEQELALRIGTELEKRGLWFVGLDFIAEKLIEINVTSPTGIQELGRLTGTRPEEDVIAWVESRAA